MVEKELTGAKQRLILDEEKDTSDKQQLILSKELDIKTYEHAVLLIDQHNSNLKQVESTNKDIELKERATIIQETELSDRLLTSTKQRVLLNIQEQEGQYKIGYLLPKELAQITAQVALLELQDDELAKKIALLEEQRKMTKAEVVIKDKEAAKLGLDNVVKNAEAARLTTPSAVYTPKYGV
jgi:hypothetical protein